MKTYALFAIAVLVAMQMVSAEGIGSMDDECEARGYDYGVARFNYLENGDSSAYVLESQKMGYNISINSTGDALIAWDSNIHVNGVVSKEGELYFLHFGGRSGILEKSNEEGISQITFCGRANGSPNPINAPNGVPEFSTMTLAIAIIVGGLGLAMLRKN